MGGCADECVCVCGVLRNLRYNQLTALPADFCSGCSSMDWESLL